MSDILSPKTIRWYGEVLREDAFLLIPFPSLVDFPTMIAMIVEATNEIPANII